MNNKLLITAALLLLFTFPSVGQNRQSKAEKDQLLAPKIFIVELTDSALGENQRHLQDELAFEDGLLRSHLINGAYNFPETGCRRIISANQEQPIILFSCITINETGESALWTGQVRGNTIFGTLRWTKTAMQSKTFYFSGTLHKIITAAK